MKETKLDPVKFEIFFDKLSQALQEGKEVVRYLSSSSIVREAGESQCAFYLPTGEAVSIAAGILMHFMNITRAIRYMNKAKYDEEDVGIHDGDEFINNDTYIGGMHLPDIGQISPFFHEGDLLGYVATISHTSETGGIEPGGTCPSATDAWHDGFHLPCVKLIEKGKMRRDLLNMMTRGVRTPVQYELDIKARHAGIETAKQRLKDLVREVGADFFKKACLQLLKDGAIYTRSMTQKLKPGTYYGQVFVDTLGNVKPPSELAVIQVNLEIRADGMSTVHVPIISPQKWCYNNTQLAGAEGTLYYSLLTQMLFGGRWNSGAEEVIALDILPKSRLNADSDRSVGYASTGINFAFCAAFTIALSRAYYASGLLDEVQAPASGSIDHAILSGLNQFGKNFAMGLMTTPMSLSGGGTLFRDGYQNYHFYNPTQYLVDAEGEEAVVPVLHLIWGRLPDSGGFGKFRGGPTNIDLGLVWGAETVQLQVKGMQAMLSCSQGLYGGYPAGAKRTRTVRNTNILELMDQGGLPDLEPRNVMKVLSKVTGNAQIWEGNVPAINVKTGDIWALSQSPGAGLGDPIERDPEMVRTDVLEGLTTLDAAKNTYCVALDAKSQKVDPETTITLRRQRILQRLKNGMPGPAFVRTNIERRHKRDLPEVVLKFMDELAGFSSDFKHILEAEEAWATESHEPIGEIPVNSVFVELTPYVRAVATKIGHAVSCKCGFVFCKVDDNYKRYCLIYERDPKEIYFGDWFTNDSDWAVYREFYCPKCGAQLEVHQCPKGMPINEDARIMIQ